MTNICRLFLLALLLNTSSAFSSDRRSLGSNEFFPSTGGDEAGLSFLFGLSWEGKEPQSENEDRLFSLASVKKIITTATALRDLGSNYRFTNEFSGAFDPLQNIVFSPSFSVSGDPTWAHPSYGETLTTRTSKVIAALKKLNVKMVVGEIQINILGSTISQHRRPAEWKKEWLLECYASLPTPVTLNGNCAELTINSVKNAIWTTAGVSTPVENGLVPAVKNSIEIIPVLNAFGRIEKYVLKGGFATKLSGMLPVHSNEEWLKNIFIQQLKDSGIAYLQKPLWLSPSRLVNPLYVDLSSVRLAEILIPFMQDSINLVGDRLHAEAPQDFITLGSLLPDPREYQNVTLLDGSGLIAANRMTPKTFFHLLKALQTQPYFQELYAGLPISGVSGTLQTRMDDAFLKNRVHAKTGTLDRVVNLAGYWVQSDQSLEPFVIFTESDATAPVARIKIDSKVADFARKN